MTAATSGASPGEGGDQTAVPEEGYWATAERRSFAPWAHVQRDQCRPDLLCISCGAYLGNRHWMLCYSMALAKQAHEQAEHNARRPES